MEPLDPGQTPGAIYTGEPLPIPTPQLPAAARKPTLAGAEAMTEYFLELYTYAFASGDTKPLSAISARSCTSCQRITANAEENRKKHYRTQGRQFTINSLAPTWEEPNRRVAIAADVHQAAGSFLKDDGSVAREVASADLTLLVRLEWQTTGWIVSAAEKAATR